MERTWLEVGEPYTSGKDRERVAAAVEALEWHPPTGEGPLSPVASDFSVAATPEPAELPEGLFALGSVVATPGAIRRMERYGIALIPS